MYIPAHFSPDEALVDELLRNHGAADLVTMTYQGLAATTLDRLSGGRVILGVGIGSPAYGDFGIFHEPQGARERADIASFERARLTIGHQTWDLD